MATLSGTVQSGGSPVQRLVRVYRRDTGEYVGCSLSNASTGAWSVTTADTSKHFAIVHAAFGDPYWSKVTLAMHMDSTGLTDVTGKTVTINGGVARVSDGSAFGGYSADFPGSGNLSVPYTTSDFDWWTQPFTLEAFVTVDDLATTYYTDGIQKPVLFGNADPASATNYWSFGPISGGTLRFCYYNGAAQSVTSAATISTGTRTHIALCSDASGIRLYMAGNRVATASVAGTPASSSGVPLTIGKISGVSFNGQVDDLLVTKGSPVARYTGVTYAVPSIAFPESYDVPGENALIYDYLTPV